MNQLPEPSSSRLPGVIMFVVGLGLAFLLKHAYDTGGSINTLVIFLAPFFLIMGGMILVSPQMWKRLQTQDRNNLSIGFVLLAVSTGVIGIVLREVVFKGWK